jgi:isoleucyl-tRNA synthetase
VEYQAKANFRVLGKELGKDMKEAAARIETLSQAEIQGILEGATLSIDVAVKPPPPAEGSQVRAEASPPQTEAPLLRAVEITAEKLDIRRIEKANLRVLNEGTLTVALDTEVSPELSREGDVRDLVRGLQNLRKEMGFAVTDRITLRLFGSGQLKAAWEDFAEYVAAETLALQVLWEDAGGTAIEAGDETWFVKIEKN